MFTHTKTVQDETLAQWLQEFKSLSTKRTYLSALRQFKRVADIEDLGKYVTNKPNVKADIRKLLNSLEESPSKTVSTYVGAVKVFLQDHGVALKEVEWRKMRRRGFMPKRVRAETRDKKPSKVLLKQILNYADIKLRALVLFLLSSGARIGESLQLKIEDFNLDADPPRTHIRDEYTKGGASGRTVYFSYEARDAIRDWLRVKDTTSKRHAEKGEKVGTYKDPLMFPWNSSTARFMWNTALGKAGLEKRDSNTDRRVYHLHSLRKFFRTKVGLDVDITHALMGHTEYLDDAYLRLEQEGEIAKAYLEAMPNVSVYQIENQELREQASTIEQENIELKDRIARLESELTDLNRMMQKMNTMLLDLQKSHAELTA